jgi:hypothetical protein
MHAKSNWNNAISLDQDADGDRLNSGLISHGKKWKAGMSGDSRDRTCNNQAERSELLKPSTVTQSQNPAK